MLDHRHYWRGASRGFTSGPVGRNTVWINQAGHFSPGKYHWIDERLGKDEGGWLYYGLPQPTRSVTEHTYSDGIGNGEIEGWLTKGAEAVLFEPGVDGISVIEADGDRRRRVPPDAADASDPS